MKILIAHNRYQQVGGEDKVVSAEAAMLARGGHLVELLAFDNEEITGPLSKAAAVASAFYSRPSYRRTAQALASFQPDVLHVHNFMPTLSPAVFFAGSAAGVPIVQTLHNYRLICASAMLFRDGEVCEDCVERGSFLPGIRHACYRGSRVGSAVIGGAMALHDTLGTWRERVERYIALSEFAAAKLGQSRVPPEKIRIKPNFVPDPGELASREGRGGEAAAPFALFVGRLSQEKGLDTLIGADESGLLPLPIHIAGDGPLRERVEDASRRPGSQLIALGRQSEAAVMALMQRASVLLVPSLWYEGFPMVIVEALSLGLPVIASRLGGLPEVVEDGVCGLLHTPGDPAALGFALRRFTSLGPEGERTMRAAARRRYLERYSVSRNYQLLMAIYAEAIESAAKRAMQLL